MSFQPIRDGMGIKPGLYITVHGGGWVGAQIRRLTHAPVAHVIVYVGPIGPNGEDFLEADAVHGVRWTSGDKFNALTSYPAKDRIDDVTSARMVHEATQLVGTPYGWIADAFLAMRSIHLWVPRWAFKLKSVTKHDECAQFGDLVALRAHYHYFTDGRLPGEVTPAALWGRDYGKGSTK